MIFDSTPTIIGHRGAGSTRSRPSPVPPAAPDSSAGATTGAAAGAGAGAGAAAGAGAVEGGDGHVAENTLASLLTAVEAGLDWVEIDVQRSADDRLVLRHDPTTTDGDYIIDRTAAATGLPLLADVFDALPPSVAVDVDVKTILEDAVDAPSRRTGALLVPLLARELRRRRLLVTSFDPALLMHLREQLPELPLGLLTWLRFPIWHGVPAAAGLGLQAIAVHTASCGTDGTDTRIRPLEHLVDTAHKADLEFIVWCPSPEDAPRYVEAGADALVVDDIPGVLDAL